MPGQPIRQLYNAKSRQSTAGSRKKGKQKKIRKVDPSETPIDSNALILSQKSKEDKDAERKEKLLKELADQSQQKWTTKKKRRLEKYIDKKLKREDRVLILDKLAKSQASLSSSLLQSSASLGSGKSSTNQDRQEWEEDKSVKKFLLGRDGKRKRHRELLDVQDESDLFHEGFYQIAAEPEASFFQASSPITQVQTIETSSIGSALRRNNDGSIPKLPLINTSKGKGKLRGWGKTVGSGDLRSSASSSDGESDSTNENDQIETNKDSAEENELSENGDPLPVEKKKASFKEWALKHINIAKGLDRPKLPPDPSDQNNFVEPPKKKRKVEGPSEHPRGPLGEDFQFPGTPFAEQFLNSGGQSNSKAHIKVVVVKRPPEIEEARILLPIVTEEQPIMEAILFNPVVIICGETGSGKTTQVPQFLYEAGFGNPGSENPGMIGITQPRRVAAMSMAARVGHELSLSSSQVSYQIRYDATVSPTTVIKFMTDGVLLRELATDFLLRKYSVIIVDEAHERSMNTDILIGVVTRVLKLREEMWKKDNDDIKPLRLVIMSATLRVSDFTENRTLFSSPPPVINVTARQHPVTIHFSRRTHKDYVTQAIKKACRIHTCLPAGGILIFLTGQSEIAGVCRRLEAKYGKHSVNAKKSAGGATASVQAEGYGLVEKFTINTANADFESEEVDLGLESELINDDESCGDSEESSMNSDNEGPLDTSADTEGTPMHIIPLYSLLSSDKQMRVFQAPPDGHRLVVVSTNIAETSLTIPGIRYVVDCGRSKERRYDATNGIQSFQISWIAKSSAAQRAGRAGRTGPGHCYRLYSSALFEQHFEKYSRPEITRIPIESVVLQMKSMHIDAVINFPFPTPPDRVLLGRAEKTLAYLGALSATNSQITDLGRTMALFPISPRFSRMLVNGQQHGCLSYVICILSALSVGDPFIYEETLSQDNHYSGSSTVGELRKSFYHSRQMHSSLGNYASDLFKLLSVVGAYEYANGKQKFCSDHFVRPKAMDEIHNLRLQINNIVCSNFPSQGGKGFSPNLPPPSEHQIKVLKQLITAGFIDQVAVRKDLVDKHGTLGAKFSTSKGVAYRALNISEDVYIHPSSILFDATPPDYIVYHEVVRTSRLYLKGLTKINPRWLSYLGKSTLCTFSKPIPNKEGTLMVIPRFGLDAWELPAINAETIKQ